MRHAGGSHVRPRADAERHPGPDRIVRSTDPSFATILDSLDTAGRSAAFTYSGTGAVYHRVLGRAGCGVLSGPSAAATVTFVPDRPRVVVARQPSPAILKQGGNLDALKTTLELKNISRSDFIGAFNTIQPIPFFRPAELLVSLRPGETKTFTLEYTGVPSNAPGRFDGLIVLTSLSATPLDVVPYATVALLVTPEKTPATAAFGTDSVAFTATAAQADPAPITVTIKNPGSTPMALTGEVGPEVWAAADSGWNATPLAPGESRTVTLRSRRLFGAAGGAFPRYTYFTVRTMEGATSRLLVRTVKYV